MKFVDYHVHSDYSCDGKSTIFELCQKAIEIGIAEIGFSEHMDFEPKDWGYGFFNYDKYTSEIQSAKEFFKDKLVIHKGVEIDYQHCFEDKVKAWLQNKEFDFVIGSVHYLHHEIIGHRLVKGTDLREIYDAYFTEITYSIESCLFDVLGHFDFISSFLDDRRSELKSFDYWGGIRTILEKVLGTRMYLEVNCKGLRDTYKDTMPSKEIVKNFIENGGSLISLGSDAHSIQEIGSGIKEILDFLENCNENKFRLLFE